MIDIDWTDSRELYWNDIRDMIEFKILLYSLSLLGHINAFDIVAWICRPAPSVGNFLN